ncbi:MAG TPA: adenine phosphoribosyltransferase [Acidimicrobiales bacterium]|nr:adenine phosphoribosyltransferase [Acidimicrobiales bacterium]
MRTESGWLKDRIRDVPDFPRPGVVFRDITPLLRDPNAFRAAVDALASRFAPARPDKVLGIEARGFILAAPVAYRLGAGFVPARKAGKLPSWVEGREYDLEYGTERLEVHADAIGEGESVLVVDDVIATGGTATAACELVGRLGGTVAGVGVVAELAALGGRERLPGVALESLVRFD